MEPVMIARIYNTPLRDITPLENGPYFTYLKASCEKLPMYGAPFSSWFDFHQNAQRQYRNNFQVIGINDLSLIQGLDKFQSDLVDGNESLLKIALSDECYQNIFLLLHNIIGMYSDSIRYQLTDFCHYTNSKDEIPRPLNISIQIPSSQQSDRHSEHQRKKRQTNQLQASFDHWPTSDATIKAQIENVSKRIQALQTNNPHFQNTLVQILKDLEEINFNGSAIIQDLEALEQELLSSAAPHLLHGSKEKVAQLIREMKDLVKFLSLYQTVCPLIDQKPLDRLEGPDVNQTTLLLNGQSKQQRDVKEGLIPSWILYGITAVVSAIFGWILPRIRRRRHEIEDEDLDQSVENADSVDESGSTSQEEEETSFVSKRRLFEQQAQQEAATKEKQSCALADHVHKPIDEEELTYRTNGWGWRRATHAKGATSRS